MKTGLGLQRRFRSVLSVANLIKFGVKKTFIGFDVANIFIKRVDKRSLILILKRYGAKIGDQCNIDTGLVFYNCNDYSNLTIGNNCHIGEGCFFDLKDKIIIGNDVVISMKCIFITHTDMNRSLLSQKYPAEHKPVKIFSNAYIGANSTVLPGVEIGEKSIIAAGSIVTENVDALNMVAGVPARFIKGIDQ